MAAKRSQCSRLERGIPFVFAKNPFFSQLFQTSILPVVFSDSKKLVAIEHEKCMKPANSCDSAEKLFELMGAGNGRYVHDRCGVYGSRVVTHMLGRRDNACEKAKHHLNPSSDKPKNDAFATLPRGSETSSSKPLKEKDKAAQSLDKKRGATQPGQRQKSSSSAMHAKKPNTT